LASIENGVNASIIFSLECWNWQGYQEIIHFIIYIFYWLLDPSNLTAKLDLNAKAPSPSLVILNGGWFVDL